MKKTNLLYFALLLSVATTFTSCFDIIEELFLNKNGSGTYSTTIDMSKAMSMMTSMMPDSLNDKMAATKHTTDSAVVSNWVTFDKSKGISNIKKNLTKDYVYTISMDFKDADALNNALYENGLFSAAKKTGDEAVTAKKELEATKNLYNFKGGTFKRGEKGNYDKNLLKTGGADKETEEMTSQMLKDMKYTILVHTPKEVRKTANKAATVSADKKTVTLEASMLDVVKGKVKLNNEIKF